MEDARSNQKVSKASLISIDSRNKAVHRIITKPDIQTQRNVQYS